MLHTCILSLRLLTAPLALLAILKAESSHSDSDGMGSIPAIPDARNLPLLLCHEWFNEASLPAAGAEHVLRDRTSPGGEYTEIDKDIDIGIDQLG